MGGLTARDLPQHDAFFLFASIAVNWFCSDLTIAERLVGAAERERAPATDGGLAIRLLGRMVTDPSVTGRGEGEVG